jgi:hypothetical protein
MESTTSKRELQPQRESGTRDSIWAHYQVEEADLTISEPPRYEIIQGRIPTVGSTSSQRRNALGNVVHVHFVSKMHYTNH